MVRGRPRCGREQRRWDLPTATRRSHDEATEQRPVSPSRSPPACRVRGRRVITGTPAYSEGRGSRDVVQRELDALVRDAGFPAALATYQDSRGRSRDYTAGVGDLETGARVPLDGQVRIGSNSKTFVAVALLQLVDEGKRRPRRARRDVPARSGPRRRCGRHPHHRPAGPPAHQRGAQLHRGDEPGLLRHAAPLRRAARAAGPGADPAGDASRGRLVVQQHQLRHRRPDRAEGHRPTAGRGRSPTGSSSRCTCGTPTCPDRGEEELRERHPRGYHAAEPGEQLRDITVLDPSWAWAAGDIVSTPSDLDAFFVALLGGELLPPALLAQMQTTVETVAGAARHAVRAGPLQHPAELRRGRLGARRQHPRVRDGWRCRARRPVGDRRRDRAAGGDGGPGRRPAERITAAVDAVLCA